MAARRGKQVCRIRFTIIIYPLYAPFDENCPAARRGEIKLGISIKCEEHSLLIAYSYNDSPPRVFHQLYINCAREGGKKRAGEN